MPENEGPTTFDDFSIETSKGLLNALQELKNLKPQLYSAADYCEKSYLHNGHKQMVLDNLKDYTLQVLVNAVDHLGTVACKLNDLFQQQAFDISTTELRISCLNQQLHACQMYTDKGGLRQRQLLLTVPQHHKHYILPSTKSRNKKVEVDDVKKGMDSSRAKRAKAKPRPHPSGTPASKTLYWHLALEAESERNVSPNSTPGCFHENSNSSEPCSRAFLPQARYRSNGASPSSNPKTWCTTTRDAHEQAASNRWPVFGSFNDHPDWRETSVDGHSQPLRSKTSTVLSAFFVKNKCAKQNN